MQSYSQRIYIQQSNWVIFDHFGHYFQIIFNLYSYYTKFNSIHINLQYIIHLVNKFQFVITYECKLIHKEFIYSNQIGSFLTILDTISRLFSIYIHIAPDLIRYTLTTIYYRSCQKVSVCYNLRVQSYSQRIYIQQSNWVIFDHFGHYFQIIFNLYSYYTKFNSIHINFNILSILFNKFQFVITYECKLIHKEFIYSNQIGSFLTILDTISRLFSIYIHITPDLIRYTLTTIYYTSCQKFQFVITYECKVIHKEFIYSNQIGSFLTILDTISRLFSIYIHIAPDLIRYTLITIYYPSCQQISVCYNLRVQAYSQRIYIQQSNWVIFDHFGHYFQIIFNLYSYCTRFNSIQL